MLGDPIRVCIAVMMIAHPALSSAPRSVVPSEVTMDLPMFLFNSGFSDSRMTTEESPGSTMSPPGYDGIICGFTSVPDAEGDVSTCATSPTTGTFPRALWEEGRFEGSVAVTYPYLSICASFRPNSLSSFRRRLRRSNCFFVLGYASESSCDCVSIFA